MKRLWPLWMLLSLSLAVVFGVMSWLSLSVLRLERAEATARYEAAFEEQVRLALWRADSALPSLLARESTLTDQAAATPARFVRLRFEMVANGAASTSLPPDVPRAAGDAARDEFHRRVRYSELAARLSAAPTRIAAGDQPAVQPSAPQQLRQQAFLNYEERQARNRAVQIDNEQLNAPFAVALAGATDDDWPRPLWVGDMLLLARRLHGQPEPRVEGVWLDWPALQGWLAEQVADVFPKARFEPAADEGHGDNGRMLAALPVRLVPGAPARIAALGATPVRLPLWMAWACAVAAVVALLALVWGTVALGERRAAFVSAVTHELRSPLTTFRLYTDLLAAGDPRDIEKQRDYLRTLSAEAVRLNHLVDNVLAYAQLERGRRAAATETLTVADLLSHATGRLAERAAQAGLTLHAQPPASELAATRVQASAGAVEQILFNLVDNACKYAAGSNPPEIRMDCDATADAVLIRVRDHGPGIPAEERGRLFRPFHKSARDAAHSAPGVGLGLALSRRLARHMGGDLRLLPTDTGGACFELRLRRRRDHAAPV